MPSGPSPIIHVTGCYCATAEDRMATQTTPYPPQLCDSSDTGDGRWVGDYTYVGVDTIYIRTYARMYVRTYVCIRSMPIITTIFVFPVHLPLPLPLLLT